MLPERYILVFMVMIWGMISVPAHAAMIKVTIENLVFAPADIKAKAGDTIVWINKDILAHTATERGGFDIMIEPNAQSSLVVTAAGNVTYYCRFHPNMQGRISIAP